MPYHLIVYIFNEDGLYHISEHICDIVIVFPDHMKLFLIV